MKLLRLFLRSIFVSAGVFYVYASPTLAQWTDPKSGTLKTDSGLPSSGIDRIVSNLMLWMLSLVGFLAIIGFLVSGVLYLTSAGNDKQVTTAKTAMKWSIVGVVVALLGAVVMYAANDWLDGGSPVF